MKARCPVCFRRDCKREHRDIPQNSRQQIMCKVCSNPMREKVPDGLCGFCKIELTSGRAA